MPKLLQDCTTDYAVSVPMPIPKPRELGTRHTILKPQAFEYKANTDSTERYSAKTCNNHYKNTQQHVKINIFLFKKTCVRRSYLLVRNGINTVH